MSVRNTLTSKAGAYTRVNDTVSRRSLNRLQISKRVLENTLQ